MQFFLVLSVILLPQATLAETPTPSVFPDFLLTEVKLIELARGQTPERRRIESRREAERARLHGEESKYQWSLGASSKYTETNEQPLLPQIPIFSPVKTGDLFVKKNLSYGVSTKTGMEAIQQSSLANGIDNRTTTRVFAQADISLWKNLFGRLSRSMLVSQQLVDARAELTRDIEKHAHEIQVRKIYWSLVANERSSKVTQELLTTAERQLKEAKRRRKNSVADKAEVARYQAQLSTRKSQLLVQKFERESILTQLRVTVPELNAKNIILPSIDSKATQAKVMKCVEVILKAKSLPIENSKYDEIIAVLRMQKEALSYANNAIDNPDLKLIAKLMTTGVGSSYGNSSSDFANNNRSGFQVGINLNIPLGGDLKRQRDSALVRDHMALNAEEEQIQASMIASHSAILKNIDYLIQAAHAQRASSEALRLRVKEVHKKFRQARVSVTELVTDQDDLLNSELSTIQTQLAILNSLFNYFEIFTETPCDINRKAG